MNLQEYQGKKLFKNYNISVPQGKLITSAQPDPLKLAKAQFREGKRGKRGLIKPATKENLKELFKHTKRILVEEKIEIEKEFYLSLVVSREEKRILIIFSEKGGIEVEEEKEIIKLPYSHLSQFPRKRFLPLIKSLYRLMKDYQALLVEINPLALSKGKLLALDAKIVLDDNVSHPEFKQELDPLEKEALKSGFSYLSLEGEIGIIGNGAGLVMATLDMITYFGGKAANFLDLGGGASLEKTVKSLEIVSRRNPKVIFVNIFGGITRCDLIAQGIIDYQDHQMSEIPLVIRMVGTNQKKGEELLLRRGIKICHSMEEGVKKAIEYVYSRQ